MFKHHEERVKLPDEVWAAFPRVQVYLSQDGAELRLVIVPAEERYSLMPAGPDGPEPEVTWLQDPRFV